MQENNQINHSQRKRVRRYYCHYKDCTHSYARSRILQTHIKTTHQNQVFPFKCEKCDRLFNIRSHLILHLRIHSGERPYKCNQCLKEFTSSSNLSDHTRRHINLKQVSELKPQTFNFRSYACFFCLKRFYRKHQRNDHYHACSQRNKHFQVKNIFSTQKIRKITPYKSTTTQQYQQQNIEEEISGPPNHCQQINMDSQIQNMDDIQHSLGNQCSQNEQPMINRIKNDVLQSMDSSSNISNLNQRSFDIFGIEFKDVIFLSNNEFFERNSDQRLIKFQNYHDFQHNNNNTCNSKEKVDKAESIQFQECINLNINNQVNQQNINDQDFKEIHQPSLISQNVFMACSDNDQRSTSKYIFDKLVAKESGFVELKIQ